MGYWDEIKKAHNVNKRIDFKNNPGELLKQACEYFEDCDNRPWNRTDFKGKDVERVEIPTQTPYTYSGLQAWLGRGKSYISDLRGVIKDKIEDFQELNEVIDFICNVIDSQQLEGSMVGAYNAQIVSRLQGLTEKIEEKSEQTVKTVRLTAEQFKEIKKEVEENL